MPARTRTFVACALGVLALTILAYSNHFGNTFHFDDTHTIVDNAYVHDITNLPRFFTDVRTNSATPNNQVYRPLLLSLFALDYWIGGGLNPVVFHLTIFAFFLLLGFLLFLVLKKVMDQARPGPRNDIIALIGTALFLLSPANTEGVNYIFSSSEVLVTVSVLAAFALYLYRPAWRKYCLYLIPIVLGSLVKLSTVMFGPLLFVYLFFFEHEDPTPRFARRFARALAQSAPALILSGILYLFVRSMDAPWVVLSTTPVWNYLITQPFVLLSYVTTFFLPIHLSVDTDWGVATGVLTPGVLIGVAFIILSLIAAYRTSLKREMRPIAFGILWYFIAALPTSSIVPFSEVTNDHRAFFSYVGLVLALVWSLYLLFERHHELFARDRRLRALLYALIFAVLAASAIGTYNRNKVWKTEESLWQDAAEKSPLNGRALMNYGLTQMARGHYSTAKEYFERGLTLLPAYPYLEINLGIVNNALENTADAEAHFARAYALAPDLPQAAFYYGQFLYTHGSSTDGFPLLAKALTESPGALDARDSIMQTLADAHDYARLADIARQVLASSPNDPTALRYLGMAATSTAP